MGNNQLAVFTLTKYHFFPCVFQWMQCVYLFPSQTAPVHLLSEHDRIQVHKLAELRNNNSRHCILDVRTKVQFEICQLPNSINIPLSELKQRLNEVQCISESVSSIAVICRRGNDSQEAVQFLHSQGISAVDVVGGLEAWSSHIDPEFPIY
jgi:adenylyltransferase/sulfurtransferase